MGRTGAKRANGEGLRTDRSSFHIPRCVRDLQLRGRNSPGLPCRDRKGDHAERATVVRDGTADGQLHALPTWQREGPYRAYLWQRRKSLLHGIDAAEVAVRFSCPDTKLYGVLSTGPVAPLPSVHLSPTRFDPSVPVLDRRIISRVRRSPDGDHLAPDSENRMVKVGRERSCFRSGRLYTIPPPHNTVVRKAPYTITTAHRRPSKTVMLTNFIVLPS